MNSLFTSESVTEGHPDKICDQISDAILDEILKNDENARVACETSITTGLVLVTGEISTNTYVDIPKIVRNTINQIGYTRGKYGFDGDTCAVLVSIDEQSRDIAVGVDQQESIGAGDQGLVFGFATNETEELMPLPISISHKLAKKLSEVRKSGQLNYLRPDGKTQVTIEYNELNQPVRVDTIVISTQHHPEVSQKTISEDIKKHVINETVPKYLIDEKTKFYINPTGRFVVGGPKGDAGLTGRKIIVDTYGGYARHGGGAFSGKDSTKVDRSGAYAARYVAKNLVAANLASKCEIQLAYAIGVVQPVSINVNTFGTGKRDDSTLVEIVKKNFDLSPLGIIKMLNLNRPIYNQTAAYGHFGREDVELPWEKIDKVSALNESVEAFEVVKSNV
jgi:S-adenosylmethionine synthetase